MCPDHLLSRVSGIGERLARSIVDYREAHGPFRSRAVLKQVPRLGLKAFELSAGFLRVRNGDDPLDASGVTARPAPPYKPIGTNLIGSPSCVPDLCRGTRSGA
jgi:uncharacterized protein